MAADATVPAAAPDGARVTVLPPMTAVAQPGHGDPDAARVTVVLLLGEMDKTAVEHGTTVVVAVGEHRAAGMVTVWVSRAPFGPHPQVPTLVVIGMVADGVLSVQPQCVRVKVSVYGTVVRPLKPISTYTVATTEVYTETSIMFAAS